MGERRLAVDLAWADERFPQALPTIIAKLADRGWALEAVDGEIRTFARDDDANYGEELVRAQHIVGQWLAYDPDR